MTTSIRNLSISVGFIVGSLLFSVSAQAALLTFEGLADLDIVTTQFSAQGVVFDNATVAVAPPDGGLNEIDFPPTSGTTVLTNEVDTDQDLLPDDVGSLFLTFNLYPIASVSGFFVYADFLATGDPLTVSVFSPFDTLTPVASLTLLENLGNPAFLSFGGVGPIGSLSAIGGGGSYFTLDNLNIGDRYQDGSSVIPEPSTALLFFVGLTAFAGSYRFRRSSR